MDPIERVGQLLQMPKSQFADAIRNEQFSFFKGLKHLPDERAEIIYKAFQMRWDEIEQKIDEAKDTLEATGKGIKKCKDEEQKADQLEDLSGLLETLISGFEIREKHKDRKIPLGHRLVIEATLIEAMERTVAITTQKCKQIGNSMTTTKDQQQKGQAVDLQLESRRLVDLLFQANERYLKSYLEMSW